jgi:mRNA-degrading endonuclease RelE of RelBE toxin-antitoxin system
MIRRATKEKPMNKKSKQRNRQHLKNSSKGRLVRRTSLFERAWRRLPPQVQKTAQQKINILVVNSRHPSLQIHRMKRAQEPMWVCYVSWTYRLLYRWQDTTLVLCDVGRHRVVDRVRRQRK